ncbi:MAG: tandem-95 repeat protein [Pirellulaceae bacterium]
MTRRQKRRRFSSWLAELFAGSQSRVVGPASRGPQSPGVGRRVLVEPLEARQLMAADGFSTMIDASSASNSQLQDFLADSMLQAEGELSAEGEDAPDLVAFAKALADSGTRFFGAAWCPFCTEQKELFEDGYKYLPFIEVTTPDRTPNQVAILEGISNYPTWEFPDSTRLEGVLTLATISQRSGVPIPQSSTPSLDELPNVSVGIGSPLHVPVDAYDPNGNPLTISVTSSDPSLITANVLSGNRSLRISTGGFGDMVFELFEDKAPVPAGRVIELAQDGFYDGVIFHRVVNNFVIQGGDPTGSGSGGSTLGDFDDQYHVDLQHNRTGVLSYAKSTDDTNDSQFFITEGPQRFLDFNHSIFGQLVEGDAVREAISNTAVSSSRPINDVVIESATVFNDTENGVLILKPTGSGTGTATITVTVQDNEGNSSSRSFVATVVQDTANGGPFLNPIPDVTTPSGTPVTINLTSQDVEGDPVSYSVQATGAVTNFGLTVDSSTGVATVTPPANFNGTLQFIATVQQTTATTTDSKTDTQLVNVIVTQNAPTGLDLLDTSDSGANSTDNLTNAQSLTFLVAGTTSGATVSVRAGGNVVGTAVATGTSTEVTVSDAVALGEGSVLFTATQTVAGQVSGSSPGLAVVLDRTGPAVIGGGVFPSSAIINQDVSLDLAHPEEGQGLVYALTSAPSGMTINAQNGQIQWTPTSTQLGAQALTLVLTDAAGNTTDQQVTINVIEEPLVQISLNAVSLAGVPLTTISLVRRSKSKSSSKTCEGELRTGVFAAYMDLLFDSNVIEPIATNPISHVDPYDNDQSGTVQLGLIDELGAFSNRTSRLGPDSRLFAEVTFLAKASGNANLRTESADQAGNEVLLYDEPPPGVPATRVDYGASDFAVGANFELNPDSFNFNEDSGVQNLDVLTNDTVTGNAVLTITSVGTTSNGGVVTIATDGKSLNYTSASNFNGGEVFTYTAANQDNVERTTTVTVQVTDTNDPPVALNDTFSVLQNSSNNVLEVLLNDTTGVDDSASESLRVSAVSTGSAGGVITVGSSGLTVLYTPAAGFQGSENFTYTLSDGRGGTATATVSVSVAQENPPPTPQDDSFTVVEDADQASFDVLANDTTDDPTETLSISSVGKSLNGGEFSVSSDGQSVLYKPGLNFSGQEILTYTLRDSNGATAPGRVTFTVTPVNDPPVAVDDSLTALSSQASTSLDVLANDTNVDSGETLTITAVTQPANGSVSISADGRTLLYAPPASDFEGSVSFTYTLSDGTLTDTATVTLQVRDFVPRSITGTLATDGFAGSLGGLTLELSGSDFLGAAVAQSTQVAANGAFAFTNLAPGNYTLKRDPLPFLVDSGEQISIVSGLDDGDMVTNFVVSGNLRPTFIDIRDFLGTNYRNSLTAAVSTDGTQVWVAPSGSWSELAAINVQGSDDSMVVINAVDDAQQSLATTLPVDGARASNFSDASAMRLIRVRGNATASGLQPVAASASSVTANSSTGGLVGEGEGAATPAIVSPNKGIAPASTGVARNVPAMESNESLLPSVRSLVSSSSALSSAAVDSLMEDVLPSLTRRLSSDLESTLTDELDTSPALNDLIIGDLGT